MARLSGRMKMALWALLGLNVALIAWVAVIGPRLEDYARLALGQGDYLLQATDGTAFTKASLLGAPTAVFFGFTHCPDVCPTTLGDISAWQEDIGGSDELDVYFVTVDPDRDTVGILTEYVGWVTGVAGVSGDQSEVDKALESFGIFAQRVQTDGNDYTMDHSASVLLFDEDGQFFETIRYQEDHDVAVSKLRMLMALSEPS